MSPRRQPEGGEDPSCGLIREVGSDADGQGILYRVARDQEESVSRHGDGLTTTASLAFVTNIESCCGPAGSFQVCSMRPGSENQR
jgi:hypothetical protein